MSYVPESLNTFLKGLFVLAIVGIICGIWKLVDLIIWAVNHISIMIK
jgi:hypothetical protein